MNRMQPLQQLMFILCVIAFMSLIAWITFKIMNCYETDEWKERRNRHRMYDPIEHDNSKFITTK